MELLETEDPSDLMDEDEGRDRDPNFKVEEDVKEDVIEGETNEEEELDFRQTSSPDVQEPRTLSTLDEDDIPHTRRRKKPMGVFIGRDGKLNGLSSHRQLQMSTLPV
ncbi:uncharacterized protein LOC136041772 [Artemia franciscana]|uniref:uncharacterized protein LOC136041772 n=1 Tax=Artemia franciscana TaxID=6661 RepID=UPI0032DA4345